MSDAALSQQITVNLVLMEQQDLSCLHSVQVVNETTSGSF